MARIKELKGNILESRADAIVNTVNCVGVMGKGIALQFKQAFPDNFTAYKRACDKNQVRPGSMFVHETGRLLPPKYIINFPTKRHWKGRARIDDIRLGLDDLVQTIESLEIRSVAVPPLGCGNGGLEWSEVAPLIQKALGRISNLEVALYLPVGAPDVENMPVSTSRPRMTRVRAVVTRLIEAYRAAGYGLGLLEVQKIAYLLQSAGEPLRLRYSKQKFGPYAETLNHVLQRMEGHFIRGYGDRRARPQICVEPGASEEASELLASFPEAQERLADVQRLIEGFETPYGLELLTTTLWVARQSTEAAADSAAAVRRVHGWSSHKRARFPAAHIEKAWQRLHEAGWI